MSVRPRSAGENQKAKFIGGRRARITAFPKPVCIRGINNEKSTASHRRLGPFYGDYKTRIASEGFCLYILLYVYTAFTKRRRSAVLECSGHFSASDIVTALEQRKLSTSKSWTTRGKGGPEAKYATISLSKKERDREAKLGWQSRARKTMTTITGL